jgi:hypothetical protein
MDERSKVQTVCYEAKFSPELYKRGKSFSTFVGSTNSTIFLDQSEFGKTPLTVALPPQPAELISQIAPTLFQLEGRLLTNSLFSVFLKTKVPNGICLRPRLSKNLSQALRTDKICPGRRSLNFSTSRLEFEPRDPTGLSLPNLAPKRYFVFIGIDLYIKGSAQSWYLF